MKIKIDIDKIQIATPCVADWDNMEGTDQVRHCTQCKKDVFNISEMTRNDAENLFLSHTGKEQPCIRLYRRFDGTVIIDDCPVGLRKLRDTVNRTYYAASLLIAFIMSCTAALAQSEKTTPLSSRWQQAKLRIAKAPRNESPKFEALMGAPPPLPTTEQESVNCRVLGSNTKWTKQHGEATNASVACTMTVPMDKHVFEQSELELLTLSQESDKRKQFILAATSLNNAANCQWYQNRLNDAKITFAKAQKLAMQAAPAERQPIIAVISENMHLLELGKGQNGTTKSGNVSWLLTQIGGTSYTEAPPSVSSGITEY